MDTRTVQRWARTSRFRRVACGAPLALLCLGACGPVVPEPFISAGLTVAQIGTASFYQGEMQAALRAPLDQVYGASLDSLAAWQLEIDNNIKTDKLATITAREMGGRLIEINIRRVSPVVTSLRIKVGFLGDQPISRLLLDEVSARLTPSPTPTPLPPLPLPAETPPDQTTTGRGD